MFLVEETGEPGEKHPPVSKNIYLSNVSYEYINVTLTASNYAGVVVIVWYLDLQLPM
jgi:hypothetical protein